MNARGGVSWRSAMQLLLAAAGSMPVAGQAVRPAPRAPVARDSASTTRFDVAGIPVIHRLASNSEIVVANLYLLGGVRQITVDNAGIEPLLLELTERGTRAYPKERLRRAMARLGTSIVTDIAQDWTSLGIRATRSTFDSTWAVFASRIMQPTLDSTEFAIVRTQLLGAVRQRKDSPDALLEYLADSVAYGAHSYALSSAGTEESIARLSVGQMRRYHDEQFVKSRMLLVVVGNIPRAGIERLVNGTLGRLPVGSYTWTLPDTLPRGKVAPLVVERALPTNYILGRYAGPPANSADYHALRIATSVLSGQLFGEVRSRRNLSYAVEAPFVDHATSAGGLYVTTISPSLTLEVMRQQVNAVKTGSLGDDALKQLVNQFITQYFLENESNASQADFLARAWLFRGELSATDQFVKALRAVRADDIRRVAQRYMRDIRFVYIGDPRQAPLRVMERF